jgi:hypothetical protein
METSLTSLKDKIMDYIYAGFPIIHIDTLEEDKIDETIVQTASALQREVYEWNGAYGYIDFETKEPVMANCGFRTMLEQFRDRDCLENKILVLKDINPYLDKHSVVSKLKGIAKLISQGTEATIIIISDMLQIPRELELYTTTIEPDCPNVGEIRSIIEGFITENELPRLEEDMLDRFVTMFKGMSEFEISNLLTLSYVKNNGELDGSALELIFAEKQRLVKRTGILELIPQKETLADIGGLENLKEWLSRKAKVYKDISGAMEYGVDMPKGVLIAGVEGCGRSLIAKVAANLFDVPLLRLDCGSVKNAEALIGRLSPCVLWVCGLEKFATQDFVVWLKERKAPVFVVATVNDIAKLPPELLHKGYFDEKFYLGLPNDFEREKIFRIHIRKRRPQDLKSINVHELVSMSKGFSGADIEGAVKEAVEAAFADKKGALETSDIVAAIGNIRLQPENAENMVKVYERHKFRNASK